MSLPSIKGGGMAPSITKREADADLMPPPSFATKKAKIRAIDCNAGAIATTALALATTHVYLCLDRSGSMRNADVSTGSGRVTRYDAIFQAASELVDLHSTKHGVGIDFSLMLWNDDAQWLFRNRTAAECKSLLAEAKKSNPPCGGTNFSNPFRLLRECIVGGPTSSSVVIFLSDGRPGDLRAQPPKGNETIQLTYKSHHQTYDSAAIHISALSKYLAKGTLHFVGIHASGYPWLQWLAAKYNGCFHQSSLNFGSLTTTARATTGNGQGSQPQQGHQDENRIVAFGSSNNNAAAAAAAANNDDNTDDVELVDVISAEQRLQMNRANAEVISIMSQTQSQTQTQTSCSIRETFASLSQSITTVHESASQRARKERQVVVKAENASSTSLVGRKFTATKLMLSGEKFEPHPASKDIYVWLSSHPFAQGGERNVYRMREEVEAGQSTLSSFLTVHRETTAKCPSVAKESRKEIPYKDRILFHKKQIACQERAQKIADAFNASTGFMLRSDKIKFIKCELLRVNDVQAGSGNYRYLSVEEALDDGDASAAPNPYVKYNGNNGYVLDCDCDGDGLNENAKNACEIAQAFSHFSYVHTDKQEMVVDLQGCLLKLTDPQIHSRRNEYGCGDRGERGFEDFFRSHACGPTCEELGLVGCL